MLLLIPKSHQLEILQLLSQYLVVLLQLLIFFLLEGELHLQTETVVVVENVGVLLGVDVGETHALVGGHQGRAHQPCIGPDD